MSAAFRKLLDLTLLIFNSIIAIAVPLIDAQTCLPQNYFPQALINLKQSYAKEAGDYLVNEKPGFFIGLVWLEIFLQWPLALLNIYGILGSKSWVKTTCLIYGVSVFSAMMAILGDMTNSGKASDKLFMMYYPFFGFSILSILRGLMPSSGKDTPSGSRRPAILRKKRA
ncbi:hypothetical protein ACFE04_017404 [Oxalis oulophora]